MKTINALLNSSLSTPTDSIGQSQSQNPVSPKGSGSKGNNFGNVLAQLTAQNTVTNQNSPESQQSSGATTSTGNATSATLEPTAVSASNAPGENSQVSFNSVSETTVAITESVKAENVSQLAQAEQALVSLATGLAQIIQMISQLQQSEPQQAQAALASLSSLNLSPSDLLTILNTLQSLVQKLPAEQNPLLLTSDQQANLLNQMFQQMMQAQQILLGGTAANLGNNSNPTNSSANNPGVAGVGTIGSNSTQNISFQMLFSNTNLTELAPNNGQASRVFINLETFKMSATFIQTGTNSTPGQNPGQGPLNVQVQSAIPVNSQSVVNDLNQALTNLGNATSSAGIPAVAQSNASGIANLQNNLSQNFKALVQLLMQSGVTQAALTTFLNNQQRGTENQNSFSPSQTVGQTVSANNLTQVLPVSSEIQPAIPAALTAASTNNSNAAQGTLPGENNLLVNEMGSQPVITPVQTTGKENANNQQSLSVSNTTLASNEVVPQLAIPPVQTTGKGEANNQQGLNVGNNNLTSNEMVPQTAMLPVQTADNGDSKIPNMTEKLQALSNLAQLSPVQTAGSETSFGLNAKEINTLNAVVASLNVSALHSTQGSVSMGTNTVLPSSALTMGQILGASEANQISSGSIVVANGNPSVPLVPPIPLQAPLPTSNANNVILSQLTQSQLSQPQTTSPSTTVGGQTVAVLSGASQEQLNQVVPPLVPTPQGALLNNLTSNNGVVTSPIDFNNGTSAVPAPISPSLAVVGSNVPNSSTTNNPAGINPLPRPTTIPNSGTIPLPANNSPAPPQPFAFTSLNQTANLAPTSQAPVVPALASAGEAIKTEIPNQAVGNNNNVQTAINNSQPVSTIKSLSAEAVSPVVSVTPTDSTLKTLDVSGSNTPNNSTVLVGNALLGSANFASGQTHGSSAFSLSSGIPSNVGPTGSIDSAQILNQIAQQVAAQTADAKTISRLNFQFVPESLGKVTVQIALIDQSVSARIIVTNPDIKEVLQSHMVDLKAALGQAGLQIDQLQVQVQGGGGNLLAQYYQYQQEGSGYRLPAALNTANVSGVQTAENMGNLEPFSVRTSLVNVLA